MQIIWSKRAKASLVTIFRYIAANDPKAARNLINRLQSAILPVTENPHMYPVGLVPGTYEIAAHRNYIIVYRVTAQRIEVVNVLHARQQYP